MKKFATLALLASSVMASATTAYACYNTGGSSQSGAVTMTTVRCDSGKTTEVWYNSNSGKYTVGAGTLGGKYSSFGRAAQAACGC